MRMATTMLALAPGTPANHHTPPEVLLRLARHYQYSVREAVAMNPSTPAEGLRLLADDRIRYVREAVANNPRTPADVLLKLADDIVYSVREAVVKNPSTSKEGLRKLVRNQKWYSMAAEQTLYNRELENETAQNVILILTGTNLSSTPRTSRDTVAKIRTQARNRRKPQIPIVKGSSSTRPRSRLESLREARSFVRSAGINNLEKLAELMDVGLNDWSALANDPVPINTRAEYANQLLDHDNSSLIRAYGLLKKMKTAKGKRKKNTLNVVKQSNLNFLRTYHTNDPFYKAAKKAVENMTYKNLEKRQKNGFQTHKKK